MGLCCVEPPLPRDELPALLARAGALLSATQPRGSETLDKVVYTGGSLQDKEDVLFYADQLDGVYTVTTLVTTTTPNVASRILARVRSKRLSVSGTSGKDLRIELPNVR